MKTKILLLISLTIILTGMVLSVLFMTGDIRFPLVTGFGALLLSVAAPVYVVLFGLLLPLAGMVYVFGYAFNR